MKKTFKTMLALMAGAVAFTACSNDDITENINEQKTSALKPMTFTASMEGQDGASRAAIDDLDIKWEPADKISIFDGSDAHEFTLTSGVGTTSGTFEGVAAEGADVYYALYPYASSSFEKQSVTVDATILSSYIGKYGLIKEEIEVGWDDFRTRNYGKSIDDFIESVKKLKEMSAKEKAIVKAFLSNQPYEEIVMSSVLPANQTATAGSADPAAMLMIGESDDAHSLQFKNVCAYVEVTPQFACTSISLESKGTESLAGTVTLDYNGGTPTASVTANGINKVTLSGNIAANSTYYIAILPTTLSSGFTLIFNTSDGEYKKSTTKTLALTRNHVTNLGSFEKSNLTSAPEGALTGKFNVSDTKQVYFAKGNLYYDGSAFQLEENQYSIATSWNASHVSNFFWSKNAAEAYADSYSYEKATVGDVFFTNADETTPNASLTVNGQTGVWRTLSNAEWNYLFSHYAYNYTTVCSKKGLVIAPTSDATIADSYDTTAWETAESNGFVFLPITGYRSGTSIDENDPFYENTCLYWSSTLNSEGKPYRKFFKWNGTLAKDFNDATRCNWGIGIRLVADVK